MKKLLCIILALVLCFTAGSTAGISQNALAEGYFNNLQYTISDGEVTITDFDNDDYDIDVVVPSKIEG